VALVFLGSSLFAVPVLDRLAGGRYRPDAVLTREDAPAGRGLRMGMTPVAARAGELGIPLFRIRRAGDAPVMAGGGDLAVSAAFGLWLPESFLSLFRHGVVNVHPSLLPRHRGPCPVERAILQGDAESGVTFMLTDSGWDTGPLLGAFATPIGSREDSGALSARLATLAAAEIEGVLDGYLSGAIKPSPQAGEATHAAKFAAGESWIDWGGCVTDIDRLVRALAPRPGADTFFRGRRLKVLEALPRDRELPPGTLTKDGSGLLCGCAGGSLELILLQPESRRPMTATEFAAGYRPAPGEVLGS
jgi:methionyl-tRNA formyltransferase